MIWMDVDIALASVPVNAMPLIDSTDFKTIEDAVVFNQAGLALFGHFTTTAGVPTSTAVTPTSGGDYDWTDQGTSGMYAIEIPASGGASANNNTEGFGWVTGGATGLLPGGRGGAAMGVSPGGGEKHPRRGMWLAAPGGPAGRPAPPPPAEPESPPPPTGG